MSRYNMNLAKFQDYVLNRIEKSLPTTVAMGLKSKPNDTFNDGVIIKTKEEFEEFMRPYYRGKFNLLAIIANDSKSSYTSH